jgi:DNA-binding NarL/FixJ family response regulator
MTPSPAGHNHPGPATADAPPKILLVEDTALFRDIMSIALRQEGFDVATAASAPEALDALQCQAPDITILDIALPPTMTDEGLRIAETLRKTHPGAALVVLSEYAGLGYARRLLTMDGGAHATGYLVKSRAAGIDALLDALRRVRDGELVIDPQLWKEYSTRPQADNRLSVLKDRQRDILGLLAQGYSNKAIGEKMFLAPNTVAKILWEIYDRLDLLPDGSKREDRTLRVLAVLAFLEETARTP